MPLFVPCQKINKVYKKYIYDSDEFITSEEEEEEEDATPEETLIPTKADDDDDEQELPTAAKDITGFRYYDGNVEVRNKRAMGKLLATGAPKEFFWVGYKIRGVDMQCPWTTIVLDGKKKLLDNWVKMRIKSGGKLKEIFPPEVEDQALQVYMEICKMTQSNKQEHEKLAKDLQVKCQQLGLV